MSQRDNQEDILGLGDDELYVFVKNILQARLHMFRKQELAEYCLCLIIYMLLSDCLYPGLC